MAKFSYCGPLPSHIVVCLFANHSMISHLVSESPKFIFVYILF